MHLSYPDSPDSLLSGDFSPVCQSGKLSLAACSQLYSTEEKQFVFLLKNCFEIFLLSECAATVNVKELGSLISEQSGLRRCGRGLKRLRASCVLVDARTTH